MTDNISKVVDGVNGLIKGLGGVRGILLTVANIFAIHYAKEMPRFLERIKENLFIITGYANKVGAEMQAQAIESIREEKNIMKSNMTTQIARQLKRLRVQKLKNRFHRDSMN